MRSRLAAALAGWCLIVPPLVAGGTHDVYSDYDAPITRWKVEGNYSSLEDCRSGRDRLIAKFDQSYNPLDETERAIRRSYFDALCLSTDDNRLNRK